MRFDSNRAWSEAVAVVRANREVMMAVAGVFLLLPGLLSSVVLSPVQQQMMDLLENQAALEALMQDNLGLILGVSILATLVQMVGYLACAVLLVNRGRPTVGEALAQALRGLPILVGATLLYVLGLSVAAFVLGLLVALGGALGGSSGAALGGMIMLVGLFFVAAYASVRFSLVVPVMAREHVANPVEALRRSWDLTRGRVAGLLGFYVLLAVAYFIINLLVSLFVVAPVSIVAGTGAATLFVGALVSSLVGALASVLTIAVLTRIHRQLTQDTPEHQANTFE